ncbi:MAG: MotA/TolQ/ExbB proton channel family protein [Gammaproteobacteria bacterium]|nr:MotA/TolQ/ExbB proton channel family protein [Gammaproteobacteria bacterium]
MIKSNLLAVVLFALIFVGSFSLGENSALFFNLLGMVIVLSGLLGAMFLSYPARNIGVACGVAWNAYRIDLPTHEKVIEALMELSVRSRSKGMIALEDTEATTTISYLKRTLSLLVDNYGIEEMREILETEMYYFKQRRIQHERLIRHAARLAPAFGVAGSVIGLIAMLSGIGDPDVIVKSIPIALTSTLYGIVLSNFFLTPMAENLHSKTQNELLIQKLITDGVIAIRYEQNPYRLVKRLESFLTPAARHENQYSFEEIRDKIQDMKHEVAEEVA